MKRRTKIATILTTGLLSAALVGVGFAAWTIAGDSAKDVESGLNASVTVGDMTDFSGLHSLSATMSDATLYVGGKPASDYTAKDWLTDSGVENDDLVLKITITAEGYLPATGLKIELDQTDKTNLTTLGLGTWTATVSQIGVGESGYTTSDFKIEDAADETGNKVLKYADEEKALTQTGTIEITITFSGTYQNPWTTYIKDKDTYDAKAVEDFAKALDDLSSQATTVGQIDFKITGVSEAA